MLGEARIGVDGFAFREWTGPVYPAGLEPAEMLRWYARSLDTVEISPLRSPGALADCAAAAPEGFRLAVRTAAPIAREGRTAKVALRSLGHLIEEVWAHRDRVGPLVLQVPRGAPEDRRLLRELLAFVPEPLPLAVELLDPAWRTTACLRLLSARGAALVEQAPGPLELTAEFAYLRLAAGEERLEERALRIATLLQRGIDVYAFVPHDRRGRSFERARRLGALLRAPPTEHAPQLSS